MFTLWCLFGDCRSTQLLLDFAKKQGQISFYIAILIIMVVSALGL